nr:15156_t:CDS:2 [Entrophospora candida]
MRIIPIQIFEHNYSYLIVDNKANEAAAVDPADPQKVLAVLAQTGAKLTSILTTHHHQRHSMGNIELVSSKPNLAVYGADARIPVRSFHTPSHTKGSVCYYVRDGNEMNEELEKAVFTGGCGRFAEGETKDMHNVLYNILGKLPKDTKVYCGHESALLNLQFASSVDPNNQYLNKKITWAHMNHCTVPSTIEEEFQYNPYLRVSDPAIQQFTSTVDPFEVMNTLRILNDSFNNNQNNQNINQLTNLNGINNSNNYSNGANGISTLNGLGLSGINGMSGVMM